MQIIYAREELSTDGPSIFLAGPTPRSDAVASWRPDALDVLSELGWSGAVLVPEDRAGGFHGNYLHQVDWESDGLELADCICFWVPRSLPDMPAFTTNVEFGLWASSGKCVLGTPPGAEKVRYLEYWAERLGMPLYHDLVGTLGACTILARDRFAK